MSQKAQKAIISKEVEPFFSSSSSSTVNIALNQFSEGESSNEAEPGLRATDGIRDTCFTTSYWFLELGANVRVSVVYILHDDSTNLKGFDIDVVGKCVFFRSYFIEKYVLFPASDFST